MTTPQPNQEFDHFLRTYVVYKLIPRREPVWHVISPPKTNPAKSSLFSIDGVTPTHMFFFSLSFSFFVWTTDRPGFEYIWRERDRYDEISNFHFRPTTTLGNQYFSSSSFCCFFLFEYVHDHKKQEDRDRVVLHVPPTTKKKHTQQKQGKQNTDPNKSSTAVADMTMTREMEFVNVCHVEGWIWGGTWMVMMYSTAWCRSILSLLLYFRAPVRRSNDSQVVWFFHLLKPCVAFPLLFRDWYSINWKFPQHKHTLSKYSLVLKTKLFISTKTRL